MSKAEAILTKIEAMDHTGHQNDFIKLDGLLHDLLQSLPESVHGAEECRKQLESISWVIHETFEMGHEEIHRWHFHHCKHRMLQCGNRIIRISHMRA